MSVLAGLVALVAWMFVDSIFTGYVLSVLWRWFVVPIFNLPQLPIVHAIGISLLVIYLTQETQKPDEDDERSATEKIAGGVAASIVKPAFILFFGWVVHLFL